MNVLNHTLDLLLGWLLMLPRDLALIVFALGTALLMTLTRRVVTNQDLLRRCAADLRRLKELKQQAKSCGDHSTIGRIRATVAQIKGMQLAADLRLLVVVLIPMAILAIWASERFDYLPPAVGKPLTVRGHFTASSIGQLTHLVPESQTGLASPAIQVVESDSQSPPTGTARWTICPIHAGDMTIAIRHQGETATHSLRVGRGTYQPPQQSQSGERLLRTEAELTRYLPFGSDLGSRWIGLPPWMIGYLLLTFLLVPTLKRVLSIA